MSNISTISPSEWLVASVIWHEDNLTAAEIAARLPQPVQWKLKTVNTFLARLVKKGILTIEREGRAFRYRALLPRESCVQAESASFLQRVFGGSVAPLLVHFCESGDLTDAEIAELRKILNRKNLAKTSPPKKPRSLN